MNRPVFDLCFLRQWGGADMKAVAAILEKTDTVVKWLQSLSVPYMMELRGQFGGV